MFQEVAEEENKRLTLGNLKQPVELLDDYKPHTARTLQAPSTLPLKLPHVVFQSEIAVKITHRKTYDQTSL
mgnify:CR=1 FL=1|jgi:hypothetical protein